MALCSVTWVACRWWYARRMLVAAKRLHRIDQDRLLARQKNAQARKQIELLQGQVARLQERRPTAAPVPTRAAQLEAVLRTVDSLPERPAEFGHRLVDLDVTE